MHFAFEINFPDTVLIATICLLNYALPSANNFAIQSFRHHFATRRLIM